MKSLHSQTYSFDYFIITSCVFPIITTLIDGTIFNKLLFLLLLIAYILCVFNYGISLLTIKAIFVLLVNYIFTLFFTSIDSESNINLFFYYPFMILFSCLIIDHKDSFVKAIYNNKNFILFIIRLWTVIVGISIFIPSCYYVKEGGSYYFGSFSGSIFRLGPAALFIMGLSLVSMSLFERKRDILYQIVPLYCVFMGSSRTYLISCVCLFVIAWYWYMGSPKRFWSTFIVLLVVGVIFLWNSSLGDKIRYTLDESQYGDFWFRITSSRSEFWGDDLLAWSNQSLFNKLFGGGLFFTIEETGIWAHNDFIEILCSFGIVGLIEYLIIQFVLIKLMISGTRQPIIIIICIVSCWAFNAFFNMYYTYFCALLSYPFVLIAVNKFKRSEKYKKCYQNQISIAHKICNN